MFTLTLLWAIRIQASKPVHTTIVMLAWDTVPGASSYTLYWNGGMYGTTTNQVKVAGLIVGQTYTFTVRDWWHDIQSGPSKSLVWTAILPTANKSGL